MFKISNQKVQQIKDIIAKVPYGSTIEFGQGIGIPVFGTARAGGTVGKVVFENRADIPNWHRVVNSGNHPVANAEAITRLEKEGHTIVNGVIQ